MGITKKITTMTHISECEDLITLEAYASPLLNADHTKRITLFLEGRECGTTMPAILFAGMKLKMMANTSATSEEDMLNLETSVKRNLRHLLTDIHFMKFDDKNLDGSPIVVGKTFQEKIFRHIVWDEPITLSGESDLVRNTKRNRAHTVTMIKTPTFTINSYLCRWALEVDRLSVNNKYVEVDPYLRRLAFETFESIKDIPSEKWKKHVSFSRRIQNKMLVTAFKNALGERVASLPLINPRS